MEYFVSTENTPYNQWQLELLIESFKKKNCADKLLVALAKTDAPANPNFCRNIFGHKRLFGHENIGQKKGYAPLNALYSLCWAIQYELVKQPLTVLSLDNLLFREPEEQNGVMFSVDPFFTLENAEENVGPFWDWIKEEKSRYESRWIPFGSVVTLSNIPHGFFHRLIYLAEMLIVHQLVSKKEIWDGTIRLAWSLNICDFVQGVPCFGEYTLTMPMSGGGTANFISCEQGALPNFHKSMFLFAPPKYVAFGDPIERLAETAVSPNSQYISHLAGISLASRT